MSDDAAVVWLDAGDPQPSTDGRERALEEWAQARGVRLVPLDEVKAAPALDPTLADRIEKELEHARDAIGGADADAAERALARAEQLLRDHPELPQAAWLRAEAERAWSARWLRIEPRDEARARVAWENATALDGGRAAGVGETSFPPRAKVKTSLVLSGAAEHSAVFVDGASLPAASGSSWELELAPGEHQIVAFASGSVAFASWVGANGAPLRIALGSDSTCTRASVAAVHREGDHVDARNVSCARWVAVTHGTRPGSVLVARCERSSCGPLLEWRTDRIAAESGPPQAIDRSRAWPAWATWLLVGIGAGAATSVGLVATGVFEKRAVEPRFVVGGARSE